MISPESKLEDLIATALGRARVAHSTILDAIVPTLPPTDRAFAQYVARSLMDKDIIGSDVVLDLRALQDRVVKRIEEGSQTAIESDPSPECVFGGEYRRTCRTDDAETLTVALHELRAAIEAINSARDQWAAIRTAEALITRRD